MQDISRASLLASIRQSQRDEPDSGILTAVNHGMGRPGLIPLWTGEGHLTTPGFICDEAARALAAGETFYTWQRGIPELRQALADYHNTHWGSGFGPERFFVTGGGMQAIQTALQLLLDAGDEVIIPSPAWPNFPGPMRMMGVRPVFAEMRYRDRRWSLDLDTIRRAVSPRTRAISIITPSNPLGWIASADDLIAIRDIARQHGLWILADEVYARFCHSGTAGQARTPSFMDVCEPDERVIYINTFSKNWAMTGWRIGWLQAPAELGDAIERIIQYNTSGTAAFMQRAAVVALRQGEDFVRHQVELTRTCRRLVTDALSGFSHVSFEEPEGAFYFFFKVDGLKNSLDAALRIIDEANVGLAPGGTFGPGGEGFLRMCYLRDPDSLSQALRRLCDWLDKARPRR